MHISPSDNNVPGTFVHDENAKPSEDIRAGHLSAGRTGSGECAVVSAGAVINMKFQIASVKCPCFFVSRAGIGASSCFFFGCDGRTCAVPAEGAKSRRCSHAIPPKTPQTVRNVRSGGALISDAGAAPRPAHTADALNIFHRHHNIAGHRLHRYV